MCCEIIKHGWERNSPVEKMVATSGVEEEE